MAQEIVQIQQMGDALRNTGYKSIGSAISEIIDNSIEANAKNIFIFLKGTTSARNGKKSIREIAILDDGDGMDDDKLGNCLGIGFTTRAERRGLGRFGVGLPQASLHVCPRVSAYSWQNGYENCKKVWLDIDKVKEGEQTQIDDPIVEAIPDCYSTFLSYRLGSQEFDFKNHGTMILWQECDRVNPKTARFLMSKLEFCLGQKFRYLIGENKSNIYLIDLDNISGYIKIRPNDPLMLMKNNYVLGNLDHPGDCYYNDNSNNCVPIFEPYGNDEYPDGVVEFPIKYYDKQGVEQEKNIEIKFSKVKRGFYSQERIPNDPGATSIGKHVASLSGISVVRNDREIDFGKFDFYKDVNQPEHRWWGCEIRFNSILDEAFGVANNKQYVELKEIDEEDYIDEPIKPVWLQIHNIISNTIKAMYAENKGLRAASRRRNQVNTPSEIIINEVEENSNKESQAEKIRESSDPEEMLKTSKEIVRERDQNDENLEEKARAFLENKVNIIYKSCGRNSPFFDSSSALGTVKITINTDHIFYQHFIEKIYKFDTEVKTTFELFLGAFAKTIDEFVNCEEVTNEIIYNWNDKIRSYVNKQMN